MQCYNSRNNQRISITLLLLCGLSLILLNGCLTYLPRLPDVSHVRKGIITYPSGDKYVGEVMDDKADGQGTLTWHNGQKYVGEFKNDRKNGQGTYTWPDGTSYVGEWRDDKFDGKGIYVWPDGGKYVGEFRNGRLNGQGIYTLPDGRVKEGIWKNDIFQYAQKVDSTVTAGESPASSSEVQIEIENSQKKLPD